MGEPAKKTNTYEDLYSLPENMTGEIIRGELHAFPRPHYRHSRASYILGGKILPYCFGGGGFPGGWIILAEPEIMFGGNLLVPDLAGWKQERLPEPPKDNWTTVTPDWVGEILSPGTARHDRVRKMPIYAQYGVNHLWMVDPLIKTLEVFKLEGDKWSVIGSYGENDKVRVEPFPEVEIDLGSLWWGEQ